MEASDLDARDDACSICLEPFSGEDPATVTNCKHKYHLQCILEWSQRSRECPICWQLLVLSDPASQELLAAVEVERSIRTMHGSSDVSAFHHSPIEDLDFHNVPPYADDLDFDERIMQHLGAAAMGRTHRFSRRESCYRPSGFDHPEFLTFDSPSDESDVKQTHMTSPTETQSLGGFASLERDSPSAPICLSTNEQPSESTTSSHFSVEFDTADNSRGPFNPRTLASQTPPDSPRRSRQSEFLSFSESLRSRLLSASSRYKESFSKSTRGFKEKILARNSSVKELSKEVQREVTAGVARMMERLDTTSKRTGGISSASGGAEGTSEPSHNGKTLQGNLITGSSDGCGGRGRTTLVASSNISDNVPGTLSHVSCPMGIARAQIILGPTQLNSSLGQLYCKPTYYSEVQSTGERDQWSPHATYPPYLIRPLILCITIHAPIPYPFLICPPNQFTYLNTLNSPYLLTLFHSLFKREVR